MDSGSLEKVAQVQVIRPGEEVGGFRLLDMVGKGPTWAAFKALQVSLDRLVTVKLLDRDLAEDDFYARRFLEDATKAARLNHSNLASGIDLFDEPGLKFLVVEHVDGASLAHLLESGGALAEDRALLVAHQVARGLDAMHTKDLIHRDVKPANIIITQAGVAKLADLGVPVMSPAFNDKETGRTRSEAPFYMSPEQGRIDATADRRADIYSLGAVLFHMVTGRVPFRGGDRAAIFDKHMNAPLPSVRSTVPTVCEETEVVLKQCLAKKRRNRFQSVRALLPALESALASARDAQQALKRRPPPPAKAPAPVRRRRYRRR